MVIRLLFIALLILPQFASAQKLVDEIKKKHFGTYQGVIPAYKLDNGAELIDVKAIPIFIVLTSNNITIEIGNTKTSGTYTVLFGGEDYYVLNAVMQDQLQSERILVHLNGNSITREGIQPQPTVVLEKMSRKDLKNRE